MTEKMIKVFVAFDGCEFDDEVSCRRYERYTSIKSLLSDLCVSKSGTENDDARMQVADLIMNRWADIEAIMNDE